MALLTGDDIAKFSGVLDTKEVHVPKWGGEVLIREMTIREFELHTAAQARAGNDDDGRASARLLAKVLVQQDGSRLYDDEERGVRIIAELGIKQVNLLIGAVNDLSGLDEDEEKQAEKDMEIAGESEAQPTSSS